MSTELKYIIESLLFVSEDPLPPEKIKLVAGLQDIREVRAAVEELRVEYEERAGAFVLNEVAGGRVWRRGSRPRVLRSLWFCQRPSGRPTRRYGDRPG